MTRQLTVAHLREMLAKLPRNARVLVLDDRGEPVAPHLYVVPGSATGPGLVILAADLAGAVPLVDCECPACMLRARE